MTEHRLNSLSEKRDVAVGPVQLVQVHVIRSEPPEAASNCSLDVCGVHPRVHLFRGGWVAPVAGRVAVLGVAANFGGKNHLQEGNSVGVLQFSKLFWVQ